ncbi:hypothetical protein RvY_00093 [Ramazzottius varieornatus]|uniref:Uncharacterized protein n=1 Tax=Ramazzottius varieornatus TaxID=947166 RepID=A0A1D1UFA7_RAMVA|nr:hypothetical protein RvY_00093 [Ramazzottius varieornatus]
MNILTRLSSNSRAKEMENEEQCDLSECKPSITLVDSCGREFFTTVTPRDMDLLIKYSILMRAKQEAAEESLYGPTKRKIREEKSKERKIKMEECSPEIPLPKVRIAKKDLFFTYPTSKRVPKPNRKYLEIPGPIPIDEAGSPPHSSEWESVDLSTADIPPRIRRTFLGTKIPDTSPAVKRGKYKTKKNGLRAERSSPEIPATSKPFTLLDSLRCDETLDSPGNSQTLLAVFEDKELLDNGRHGMPPTSDDHNYATKISRTLKLSRRQAGHEDIPPPLPNIRLPSIKIKIPKLKKMKLGKHPKVHPTDLTALLTQQNQKQKVVKEGRRGCRREYGIEGFEQWCRHCQWKKACTRFGGRLGKIIHPEPGHVRIEEPVKPVTVADTKYPKRRMADALSDRDRKKVRELKTSKVEQQRLETSPEAKPDVKPEVKPIMTICNTSLTPVPIAPNSAASKWLGFGMGYEVEEKEVIKTEMRPKEKQKIPLLIPLTLEPEVPTPSSISASSQDSS